MITILGNVNNAGFALPMTQAYPTDPNVQQLLGWSPAAQALDYVPFTGNGLGDFGVARDLSVVRNAVIGGTLSVTGAAAFPGGVGAIASTGNISGLQVSAVNGGNNGILTPTALQFQGLPVIGTRKTGWTAATGTATRGTFVTSTVTLPQLAERVKALLDDLIAHGMIGT